MKNELMIFGNKEFGQVRAVDKEINNESWLVGKDVAEALGYNEPNKAIVRHVDEDDRTKYPITDNLGRTQESWIINESGFYSLALRSKLPSAKQFKRWITSEVLPSVRQNGAYISENINDKQITALQMYSTKEFIKQTFLSTGVENIEERYIECMNYNSNKKTEYQLSVMKLILDIVKQRKEIALSEMQMPLVAMLQEIIINIGEDIKSKSLRSRSSRLGHKTRQINVLNNELNELKEANTVLQTRINKANEYLDKIDPLLQDYITINLHGFSVNSMYEPDVTQFGIIKNDYKGKPKMKRTEAYNIFRSQLKQFFKKKFNSKLHKDKHYDIHLLFDHLQGFDSHNFHKSFFDTLASFNNISDNNFHLQKCDTNSIVDSFAQGKIYFCIKERQ